MLQSVLTAEIFTVLMVFARIGSAFVVLPTIGESFLNPRARLTLAVLVSLAVAPSVEPLIPPLPPSLLEMVGLILIEILTGLFIAVTARLFFMALAIAGSVYSFMGGFASALMFNPLLADQGALISIFMSMMGLLLIFVTDTHHLLIRAIVESYVLFEPGVYPMVGDMADVITRVVADAFRLGIQLSAPIIVVGLLFYVLLGLLARLMPQMQVFFIAMPLQILIGLSLLMVTMSAMMLWFLQQFQGHVAQFLPT